MPVGVNKAKLDRVVARLKENTLAELKIQSDKEAAESIESTLRTKKSLRAAKKERRQAKHREAVDEMLKGVDDLKRSAGYDSFLSGMLAITSQCRLILNVNPLGTLISFGAGLPGTALEMLIKKVSGADVEVSPGAMYDYITTHAASTKKEVELPDLLNYVEFADDDTLDIASIGKNLSRKDGKAFTPALAAEFEKTMELGVKVWLDDNGYIPDPRTPNGFISKPNAATAQRRLTKAGFEALRDDPNHSLASFLSDTYEWNIEQASGPKSAATP